MVYVIPFNLWPTRDLTSVNSKLGHTHRACGNKCQQAEHVYASSTDNNKDGGRRQRYKSEAKLFVRFDNKTGKYVPEIDRIWTRV